MWNIINKQGSLVRTNKYLFQKGCSRCRAKDKQIRRAQRSDAISNHKMNSKTWDGFYSCCDLENSIWFHLTSSKRSFFVSNCVCMFRRPTQMLLIKISNRLYKQKKLVSYTESRLYPLCFLLLWKKSRWFSVWFCNNKVLFRFRNTNNGSVLYIGLPPSVTL